MGASRNTQIDSDQVAKMNDAELDSADFHEYHTFVSLSVNW